jgi:MFS family permease
MSNIFVKNKKIYALYILGLLFSVHVALPAYINSTFLNIYFPEKFVGILYTIGSLFTIIAFALMPYLLKRFGNFRIMMVLAILDIIFLFGMATFKTALLLAPIFIIKLTFINILYFNLDVFLESNSKDASTGSIRGIFLTTMNTAWVLSPMIAGYILTNGDYWKIYIISSIFMSISTLVLLYNFRNFKDPIYEKIPFWKTFLKVWNNVNIYKIFISSLILRFFYSWMVIYTPVYLHNTIGFEWSTIGTIFTIMLIPFILFEIPAGKLADSRWGEKEFLSLGFIIMAIATISLTFITSTNWIIWAAFLFLTRTGASLVEIMTETYFFKQIDGTDANVIGFFRDTRPLAYVIAPIFAFIFLTFFEQKYLFLALGIVVLLGLKYSLTLKDTK